MHHEKGRLERRNEKGRLVRMLFAHMHTHKFVDCCGGS